MDSRGLDRLARGLRTALRSPLTERLVAALVTLNAVLLGMEATAAFEPVAPFLRICDRILLTVFVIEITLRLVAFRGAFFRDPWNVFDALIVGLALVPSLHALDALRSLRLLRLLRLVSAMPSLRRVIDGLARALPGMGAVLLLILLLGYSFAVISVDLFGETAPDLFGSIGAAGFSLFRIMTFDDWSNVILKPLQARHPYAVFFFLVFIVTFSFTMLNLFIAVVCTAIEEAGGDAPPNEPAPTPQMERLVAEIAALRHALEAGRPPAKT